MSSVLTSEPSLDQGKKQPRIRLEYLDGLRGMAALYVVLCHAIGMAMDMVQGHKIPRIIAVFLHITHFYMFKYGLYAVDVFIVLSGYCLMLPVARTADQRMKDTLDFIKRRGRRILPPYYAALALAILFFVGARLLHFNTSMMHAHDMVEPVFTPGVILSHLFLIHNWSLAWQQKIDPPMWSVAVEWQIYFFFPSMLLPVFRRFGAAAAILAGLVIGLIPHFINHARFDWGHAWFLGLFAMGMAGASINFRDRPAERKLLERLPWGVLSAGFAAIVVGIASVQNKSHEHSRYVQWLRTENWGGTWPLDVLAGLATICLVIYCTHQLSKPTMSRLAIVRFFDSKFPIWIGAFSYSIYLVHFPILEFIWLIKYHLSPTVAVTLFLGVGLPVTIACAYLFHLAFERPFLSARRKSAEPVINLVPPPAPLSEPSLGVDGARVASS